MLDVPRKLAELPRFGVPAASVPKLDCKVAWVIFPEQLVNESHRSRSRFFLNEQPSFAHGRNYAYSSWMVTDKSAPFGVCTTRKKISQFSVLLMSKTLMFTFG